MRSNLPASGPNRRNKMPTAPHAVRRARAPTVARANVTALAHNSATCSKIAAIAEAIHARQGQRPRMGFPLKTDVPTVAKVRALVRSSATCSRIAAIAGAIRAKHGQRPRMSLPVLTDGPTVAKATETPIAFAGMRRIRRSAGTPPVPRIGPAAMTERVVTTVPGVPTGTMPACVASKTCANSATCAKKGGARSLSNPITA